MCLRFADLEKKLGEIDRARAVYAHCSQICDPRVSKFMDGKHQKQELLRHVGVVVAKIIFHCLNIFLTVL